MRIVLVFLLLLVNYSYAALCENGFDRYIGRQFSETLGRYFTAHETFVQRDIEAIVETFSKEGNTRKEILQYLMDSGYLTVENSSGQNRLFNDILNRSPEEVIKAIRENPDSLYDGTLLNLPPFFLLVFVGDREVMQAGIKVDRRLVNSRNPLMEVPLHYTIDPDIAGDLLHNKAKPNEQDKKGRGGLHNMRDPETVKVMLHYDADPLLRDRSGVPLIRYHREQVGDREIVVLLEGARDSRKLMNGTHNHKVLIVPRKTEEARRAELAEAERTRAERAEERRQAEEARRARRAEAEEANRRAMEERKSELLSGLADVMATTIMAKALVHRISHQTADLKVFSNVESTLQSVRTRSSNMVIYDRKLEERFEKELDEAITNITLVGKTREEYEKEISDVAESKAQDVENELLDRLKGEIGHYSLGKIRTMLNKTGNYYARLEKMMNQLVRIRVAQDSFLGGVIKEIVSVPGANAAVLRREDLIRAVPFR